MKNLNLALSGWIALVAAMSVHAADTAGWTSLFDGKTLNGWAQKNGTATYRVEDGTIVGRTATGSPNSFLCSQKDYGDFELEFEVKVDDRLNSGVQIRSKTKEKAEGGEPAGRVYGPQVEIAIGGANGSTSGYVYGEATGRGWLTPEARLKPHQHLKSGQWNQYRIVAKGARIQTWINGQVLDDLNDEPAFQTHPRGFIGLQVHGIGRDEGPYQVAWRNIRLRELK
jgi:hypothetical protein